MIWQILIATIHERFDMFDSLFLELNRQIDELGFGKEVEVLFDADDKQKSIGKKRQDLLEKSTAKYINYFDDDDYPYPYYIKDIYEALQKECDCVGFTISMTTNGENPQVCCHSIRYPQWDNNKDGYDYVRNCTHFNIVKRELAIQVGFNQDMRFGEDKDYSDRLTPLCKYEIFIDKPIFYYRYSNKIEHSKKYGIK